MLTNELIGIFKQVTYKPGYDIQVDYVGQGLIEFSMSVMVPDSDCPDKLIKVAIEQKFNVFEVWDEDEVVECIKQLIWNFELHEMDEWLRLKGKRLRNPHPHPR